MNTQSKKVSIREAMLDYETWLKASPIWSIPICLYLWDGWHGAGDLAIVAVLAVVAFAGAWAWNQLFVWLIEALFLRLYSRRQQWPESVRFLIATAFAGLAVALLTVAITFGVLSLVEGTAYWHWIMLFPAVHVAVAAFFVARKGAS